MTMWLCFNLEIPMQAMLVSIFFFLLLIQTNEKLKGNEMFHEI